MDVYSEKHERQPSSRSNLRTTLETLCRQHYGENPVVHVLKLDEGKFEVHVTGEVPGKSRYFIVRVQEQKK